MSDPEHGVVLVRELLGQELVELVELQLSVLSGESNLGREITHPRVQKPGLAFAGHYEYIKPGRVQIIGASETEYLKTLPAEKRTASFVCHLVLADPAGRILAEADGKCRGRIRFEAAGDGGFGYDSLFEIVEYHRTLAELGETATVCLSHRARAVRSLRPAFVRIAGVRRTE